MDGWGWRGSRTGLWVLLTPDSPLSTLLDSCFCQLERREALPLLLALAQLLWGCRGEGYCLCSFCNNTLVKAPPAPSHVGSSFLLPLKPPVFLLLHLLSHPVSFVQTPNLKLHVSSPPLSPSLSLSLCSCFYPSAPVASPLHIQLPLCSHPSTQLSSSDPPLFPSPAGRRTLLTQPLQ